MDIAFVLNEFPKLSETFILNQITGLLDRGHHVDIYAAIPGPRSVMHSDVQRYDLLRHTFYYATGPYSIPAHRLARAVGALRLLVSGLRKAPLPLLRSLNVLRFGSRAASLSLLYQTCAFVQNGKCQYDIVQCHYGPNGLLAALLRSVGALRGKIATAFHGYDISEYLKANGKDVYSVLFTMGDIFLPVSERWRNALIELGCRQDKIFVHRMGVDTARFRYRARGLEEDAEVRLLAVARLVEKKGLTYAIEAVAKLVSKHPRVTFKIVGDGPKRSELEALIQALGVERHCTILGPRNHEEIARLMDEADILVLPSITGASGDQEGIPVVLMEALGMGLPVVSTLHSGIPELIQDGKSGFLVAERDADALAERLDYLIDHRELWSAMGKAGREQVEKYHDINKANDQLVRLYEDLLKSPPAMLAHSRWSR